MLRSASSLVIALPVFAGGKSTPFRNARGCLYQAAPVFSQIPDYDASGLGFNAGICGSGRAGSALASGAGAP